MSDELGGDGECGNAVGEQHELFGCTRLNDHKWLFLNLLG